MKKIKKGDYGYRNHFKRKQLFIIALLALFIIAQLVGRSFTDNDSVKKDDKKAVMDIKAMDYEGYHYIVTEEFNHKKREVKDLKVTLYNPQGYVVKEEQPSKNSRKVEPGTPAQAVFQLIWGGK